MLKSLIEIQQAYIDAVDAGMNRWSHRKDGGHSARIRRGAYRRALAALTSQGWTEEQARQAIRDAHDMLILERNAQC